MASPSLTAALLWGLRDVVHMVFSIKHSIRHKVNQAIHSSAIIVMEVEVDSPVLLVTLVIKKPHSCLIGYSTTRTLSVRPRFVHQEA